MKKRGRRAKTSGFIDGMQSITLLSSVSSLGTFHGKINRYVHKLDGIIIFACE